MNNYHNPYRNPYPSQGPRYNSGYHPSAASSSESPSPEASQPQYKPQPDQASENKEQSSTQTETQGQATPPPEPEKGGSGWQNDPSLKNMDLKKLAFLSELVAESGNKPLDALLPFLISANQNANSMGLQFNDAETSLLLNVLKKHMNPEEQSRIDMLRKMADILGKK